MTEQKILEGNKLIAEFMGIETKVYSDTPTITFWNFRNHMKKESEMKYHSSWDWIMPVLAKIEKMGCIVEISFSLVVFCRICAIGKKEDRATNFIADNNGGLEPIVAAYKAVVEFIKWHNNEQTKC